MRNCSCKLLNLTTFPAISYHGYNEFTENDVICPDHHHVFIHAAGITHTHPKTFSENIYHAWSSIDNILHVFVRCEMEFTHQIAIYKSWNLINCKQHEIQVYIYMYDTGSIYCSTHFEEDDESILQLHKLLIKKLLD